MEEWRCEYLGVGAGLAGRVRVCFGPRCEGKSKAKFKSPKLVLRECMVFSCKRVSRLLNQSAANPVGVEWMQCGRAWLGGGEVARRLIVAVCICAKEKKKIRKNSSG